jgi:hypothetical protein
MLALNLEDINRPNAEMITTAVIQKVKSVLCLMLFIRNPSQERLNVPATPRTNRSQNLNAILLYRTSKGIANPIWIVPK